MPASTTSSPLLEPAYTCGSHITIIDMDDDDFGGCGFVSNMNPTAKEFVPGFYPIEDSSDEARRVDDILKQMNHAVSVYDSELLMQAQMYADLDHLDDNTALYLDQEEALVGGLHVPAQKPKGSTYGRKVRSARQSRERKSR